MKQSTFIAVLLVFFLNVLNGVSSLPLVARTNSRDLYIVAFKQTALKSMYHWGIYVSPSATTSTASLPPGNLYHIATDANLVVSISGKSPPTLKTATKFSPNSAKTFDPKISVRVASGLGISDQDMAAVTTKIATGWKYNAVTNNCQRWVLMVLREMVKNGHLTKAQVDAAEKAVPHLRGS
ncbi:hypothetical protein C8J56DRAFT_912487 [Mycena floridula]|nr:hypothetical protein C8J56DRAFT_912487 [Mycena floridula]